MGQLYIDTNKGSSGDPYQKGDNMANVVNTVKSVSQKVYNNGKTYAENVKEGIFLPAKALKNHKEVMDKLDANDKKMDLILSKLSK